MDLAFDVQSGWQGISSPCAGEGTGIGVCRAEQQIWEGHGYEALRKAPKRVSHAITLTRGHSQKGAASTRRGLAIEQMLGLLNIDPYGIAAPRGNSVPLSNPHKQYSQHLCQDCCI